jgi:hypothetical protein
VISAAASLITAAGVLVAIWAAVLTRNVRQGFPLALDLWMAAGLLRLSDESDWRHIAAAAAIVLIRKLVAVALNRPPRRAQPLR